MCDILRSESENQRRHLTRNKFDVLNLNHPVMPIYGIYLIRLGVRCIELQMVGTSQSVSSTSNVAWATGRYTICRLPCAAINRLMTDPSRINSTTGLAQPCSISYIDVHAYFTYRCADHEHMSIKNHSDWFNWGWGICRFVHLAKWPKIPPNLCLKSRLY